MLFRISGVLAIGFGFYSIILISYLLFLSGQLVLDQILTTVLIVICGFAQSWFAIRSFPWTKLNEIRKIQESDTLDDSLVSEYDQEVKVPIFLKAFGVIGTGLALFVFGAGVMIWMVVQNNASQSMGWDADVKSLLIILFLMSPFVAYYNLRILLSKFRSK